jgi:hypothetical protein
MIYTLSVSRGSRLPSDQPSRTLRLDYTSTTATAPPFRSRPLRDSHAPTARHETNRHANLLQKPRNVPRAPGSP